MSPEMLAGKAIAVTTQRQLTVMLLLSFLQQLRFFIM